MSFESCLDHTATVYRLTEALDSLRSAVNTYTAQTTPVQIALAPSRLTRDDTGPGASPRGAREAFARASADIVAEDVLDITAGPEAPAKYRVLVPSKAPKDHHLVLRLEPFNGVLA